MQRVTIADIAKRANVSPNTVSRIINGQADYRRPSFAARARLIRSIAEELGYQPNTAAQAMRSGKYRCVSLLSGAVHWGSTSSGQLVIDMQRELENLGYNMILNILPDSEIKACRELPRLFKENIVDGVIIGIVRFVPEWLESLITQLQVEKIWIGTQRRRDCIHHNDFEAAFKLTRRLIRDGHINIAYIDIANPIQTRQIRHFSVSERMNGYQKAMEEAGLLPRPIRPENYLPFDQRTRYLNDVLFRHSLPTAVITYDMFFSGRAFLCNAWKCGIRIPGDVSFAAFSDEETYEDDRKISSYVPNREMAATAISLLHGKITGNHTPRKPVVLPFDFIEGDTILPRT